MNILKKLRNVGVMASIAILSSSCTSYSQVVELPLPAEPKCGTVSKEVVDELSPENRWAILEDFIICKNGYILELEFTIKSTH